LKDLLTCCCGLDIHKDVVVACLLQGPTDNKPTSEIRSFSTLHTALVELRDWLAQVNCHHIAMESTGIYWQPIYDVLESVFVDEMTLLVVNARHMKNVSGKKTDMRDAEWIATLLRAGLLNGSFIPSKDIRYLRQLNRYRKALVHDITAQKNRVEKFLQSSGFRLSTFMSSIFGTSGINIMSILIGKGSISLADLDLCLKARSRNRIDEIMPALNGSLDEKQRRFLKMLLTHLQDLQDNLAEIEDDITQAMLSYQDDVAIIKTIPGISDIAAASIIAEIGNDMSRFKTSQHLCSWAGVSPGNYESAGKKKKARINKGNPYLKSMLCEVSWVIAGKRNTYLSSWYWRMKQRLGAKKAIIALARKLLVIVYTLLKGRSSYNELCFEQRRAAVERKRVGHMIRELVNLGYGIVPA